MAEAKLAPRPLSPHLQVYRWSWTMAMSVFHRATGTALYMGIALFAVWLVALASGPRAFESVHRACARMSATVSFGSGGSESCKQPRRA